MTRTAAADGTGGRRPLKRAALVLAVQCVVAAGLVAPSVKADASAGSGPKAWGNVHAPAGLLATHTGRPLLVARPAHGYTAETSINWSGYVDTGPTFTGVTADWTVPAVVPSQSLEVAATWVGIDGTSASTLIQTGTTSATANGRTAYFAWYELLPAPPVILGEVFAGDQMTATIQQVDATTWGLSIGDMTLQVGASGQVLYSTPGLSADWIEEAATDGVTGQVIPLANYGTVQFSGVGFTGSSPTSTHVPVYMTDPSRQAIISYPSAFDPIAAAFTVTFGSPPSPPASPTPSPTIGSPAPTVPAPTTPIGTPPPTLHACTPPVSHRVTAVAVSVAAYEAADGCGGYWIATVDGNVVVFQAPAYGDVAGALPGPVIAIVATPDGQGYWLATSNGAVRAFGDARPFGDTSGRRLNGPIVAMATTPDGGGYWLVGSDGGIFTFGDAGFFGSTGGIRLNQPVVGISSTPGGTGYWLVASDGGIFTFGAAPFLGSTGGMHLNKPVVAMTTDPGGRGYRMVASDGGLFSFGAPFFGSLGSTPPPLPIVAMAPSTDGNGYYMLSSEGAIYAFGDAPYLGGL